MIDRTPTNGILRRVLTQVERSTTQQQINQIPTPEIRVARERQQCTGGAYIPDAAAIRLLTNVRLPRYTGRRQNEDHRGPPELQTHTTIHAIAGATNLISR